MYHFSLPQVEALVRKVIESYLEEVKAQEQSALAEDFIHDAAVMATYELITGDLHNEMVAHIENGAYPTNEAQTFITQMLTFMLHSNPHSLGIQLWGCTGNSGMEEPHIHAEVYLGEQLIARTKAPTLDIALTVLGMGAWANYHFGEELPEDAPAWLRKMYTKDPTLGEGDGMNETPIDSHIEQAMSRKGIIIIGNRPAYLN